MTFPRVLTLLCIGLSTGLCIGTVAAVAAESSDPLETVVVTASRLALTVEALPGEVTVLDREHIHERGTANALDLLRDVAGLHVTQTGGLGGVSSLFIQGGEPNFTAVMIDGVVVNDPTNSRGGSYNLATLNIDEIERAEILRGPQSARYGSNGLSGLLNITTGQVAAGGSLMAEVGTGGLQRAGIDLGHRFAAGPGITIGASTLREDDQVPGEEFENNTLRLKASGGEALAFDFRGRFSDTQSQAFPEDSGGPDLAVLRETDQREQELLTTSLRLDLEASDAWRVTWHGAYLDQNETLVSPGIAPGLLNGVPANGSDTDYQRLSTGVYASRRLGQQWQAAMGLDYQREQGDQAGYLEFAPGFRLPTDFRLERDTVGAFLEFAAFPTAPLTLTGSLRRDDPDGRQGETTANVGVQYLLGRARLFATWGQAFKLPSFFALGHGLVGNSELEPETSEGWSVGIAYPLRSWLDVRASTFRTRYENLIDFDFDLFTNVNRRSVSSQGAEAAARVAVSARGELEAHVAYLDLDARDTTLRQRPVWRGGVALSYKLSERFRTRLAWLYVAESYDSSIPTGGIWLDGYDRLDARVSWQLNPELALWLAFDNVADAGYEEAIGFPAPGIRSRLGVRVTF